jgi:predicted nucleotidyltransferase
LSHISGSILKVLAYFHVFNYPITKDEIRAYLDHEIPEKEFQEALAFLAENGIVYRKDEFYSLSNNPFWVHRRRLGNARAKEQIRIARKAAAWLSAFPFVRAVAVSGSLSKNYAEENSDIDFFIITAANRLWIARTVMHLFKKITFLFGRQHWFCMNYYVDEAALEIKEKNLFTAIEVVTALPLRGPAAFQQFLNANNWVKDFFPRYKAANTDCRKNKTVLLKPVIEFLLNKLIGNWLDKALMNITIRRWDRKIRLNKRYKNGQIMGIDAGQHYCKPLPQCMQDKVLVRHQLKMEQLQMELESISTSAAG